MNPEPDFLHAMVAIYRQTARLHAWPSLWDSDLWGRFVFYHKVVPKGLGLIKRICLAALKNETVEILWDEILTFDNLKIKATRNHAFGSST